MKQEQERIENGMREKFYPSGNFFKAETDLLEIRKRQAGRSREGRILQWGEFVSG